MFIHSNVLSCQQVKIMLNLLNFWMNHHAIKGQHDEKKTTKNDQISMRKKPSSTVAALKIKSLFRFKDINKPAERFSGCHVCTSSTKFI